jgi:dihydrofolate reductase
LKLIIIVAMTKDRVIGKDGRVPWHEPEDLRHFKRTTEGHAVIMGRKTFDSIGAKPLPGRRNIVVTRNAALITRLPDAAASWRSTPNPFAVTPGALRRADLPVGTSLDVVLSLEEAIDLCRTRSEEVVFIAGGAAIYQQALPLADEMIVTEIPHEDVAGDTYFPAWDRSEWLPVATAEKPTFTITTYRRQK